MDKMKSIRTPMATNIVLDEDKNGKSVNATLVGYLNLMMKNYEL